MPGGRRPTTPAVDAPSRPEVLGPPIPPWRRRGRIACGRERIAAGSARGRGCTAPRQLPCARQGLGDRRTSETRAPCTRRTGVEMRAQGRVGGGHELRCSGCPLGADASGLRTSSVSASRCATGRRGDTNGGSAWRTTLPYETGLACRSLRWHMWGWAHRHLSPGDGHRPRTFARRGAAWRSVTSLVMSTRATASGHGSLRWRYTPDGTHLGCPGLRGGAGGRART